MNVNQLLANLIAKYPAHEFDLSAKHDVGVYDEESPALIITFTDARTQQCIVDPLSIGFDACDGTEYGLTPEDARAIREHNKTVCA